MNFRHVVAMTALVAFGADGRCGEVPGFERLVLDMPHRESVVRGAIWYPAGTGGEGRQVGENAVFIGVPVLEGAAAAEGRHPVVLLSHGLGGRFETNAWLSAGLAARGVIVLSVNHPKSTWPDFDLRQAWNHWTRAQDLRGALDWLLDDPHWMSRVDETRIAAIGYSYGGWTVLSMGGATGNLAGFAAICDSFGERDDVCRLLAQAGIEIATMDADRWNASYKDERIKAIVAIDPGLHYGLDAGNVTSLVDDVLLIGLGTGADRLPATDFGPAGSRFSALLPRATSLLLAPARHFTALQICKPEGAAILREEGDDPVCDDPEGADRGAVHRRILQAMSAHLGLDG